MGWKKEILPNNVLRRMSTEDRKPMGKSGITIQEAQAKGDLRREKDLQRNMENLLRQRNLFFVRSRMDRRTTTRKGTPDFIIILPRGRALMVEAKVEGGELSQDQKDVFTDYWNQTGNVVHIVLNLETFKQLLDMNLN